MSKKVRFESSPIPSTEEHHLKKINFYDIFSTTNHEDSLEQIAEKIFNDMPQWIQILFTIRNKLVSFIGLEDGSSKEFQELLKKDTYIGYFKVFKRKSNSLTLGLNDKHLNFRVEIKNTKENEFNIKVLTLVEFNNLFGSIYMKVVQPLHFIVVRSMVSRAYKRPQKIDS